MTDISHSVGEGVLRKEFVDGVVKGFATQEFKARQALAIMSTSAWKNTFFREDPNILLRRTTTGITGTTFGGVPRGAQFPQRSVDFQELSVVISKHAHEDFIPWEDMLSDDVARSVTILVYYDQ